MSGAEKKKVVVTVKKTGLIRECKVTVLAGPEDDIRHMADELAGDAPDEKWDEYESMASDTEYEFDDPFDPGRCGDEFATMEECEVVDRMGWNDATMLHLRTRYINEDRHRDGTFLQWIRNLAREEEAECASQEDDDGG